MNSNKTNIGSMFLLAAILVAGTISMTVPASFAQPYYGQQQYKGYEDSYGKDYDKKKASEVNIQKVKCNNIIVNGVDKASSSPGGIMDGTADEADGAWTEDGQWLGDGQKGSNSIDKNIVNICINKNTIIEQPLVVNQDCEDCFSSLDEQVINRFLMTVDSILDSLEVDAQINTLEDLCNFLETSTQISSGEKWQLLNTALGSESLPRPTIDNILQCLEDLGIIVEPS
ncbi:MAG: hypothetical protein MRJ93_00035 [Nitrososphaeraceae archaeon]|nr:hypothetical protein [Nitrososphaeraceae archaeon]